jgi:hypothetical protein
VLISRKPNPETPVSDSARNLNLLRTLLLVAVVAARLLLPGFSRAQPFQLSSPHLSTNGSFSFTLSVPVGRTYFVDSSTNFSAWSALTTNIAPNSVVSFVDSNTAQQPHHYYRSSLFWTLLVSNTYPNLQTTNAGSGRSVLFPSGWLTGKGADGRVIAYPPGWSTAQGKDGRMVAFPAGFTNRTGADGRVVAYYPTGFTTLQGNDGRLVVFPSTGWTNRAGPDARRVVLPLSSFSTTNGTDGRAVAFPSTGWNTGRGADGRIVAYLASQFVTNQGADGRKIAYQNSSWAFRQGSDGRVTTYPTNSSVMLNLDFQDQSLFPLLGALKTVLSPSDFNNYIFYTFFGTGEQQYAD